MGQVVTNGGNPIHTRELFTIEITEEGKYFAVREESPKFCIEGDDIITVAAKAKSLFDQYKRWQDRGTIT